jgi:hypothetical protein
VSGIAYIRLREEFIHLAVVRNIFTRTIRGCRLGLSLGVELTRARPTGLPISRTASHSGSGRVSGLMPLAVARVASLARPS